MKSMSRDNRYFEDDGTDKSRNCDTEF